MIEAHHLTKRHHDLTVVDDLSFTIAPGHVTGLLGPNGAGKSSTMRMIVGLDRPTSGTVTVNGRRYADLAAPLHEVGILLDAGAVHPQRSARAHLRILAATHGISNRRVEEVLALTGLESVARKRVGGFSLGMGQRLGIATALLGDPETLILDEPVNGLDPEGVIWIRSLLRNLAAEGRTVLLSSHLMAEMAMTADHLIVLGRGRLIADAPTAELIAASSDARCRVRTTQLDQLESLLAGSGATLTRTAVDQAEVTGIELGGLAGLAAGGGVVLTELAAVERSLEDVFLSLTADAAQYRPTEGTARR